MARKSIITDELDRCYLCGSSRKVEIHHCVYGIANRRLSDEYGLTIPLCMEHHTGNSGVHRNGKLDADIKRLAQKCFEEQVGTREEFMEIFGRNFL